MLENSGGKRERKKEETRKSLLLAAEKLIDQKGFSETTVQEIASEAEVSERTFFRYFQFKEDLVLQDIIRYFADIEDSLRRQPVQMEPIHALQGAIDESIKNIPQDLLGRLLPNTVMTDAHVAARLVSLFTTLESSIATIIDERLQAIDPTTPAEQREHRSRVLAFCALGASRAAMISLRNQHVQSTNQRQALRKAVNEAFALLAQGCIFER